MTYTIQPNSREFLSDKDKNFEENKPETEDNMSLLLSVLESMNNLCDKLSRLNNVIQKKSVELNLYGIGENHETKA
jgi:TorA maturation chaperone TorD